MTNNENTPFPSLCKRNDFGAIPTTENAKKEYSEFYRKIQKQLKELENELLNI